MLYEVITQRQSAGVRNLRGADYHAGRAGGGGSGPVHGAYAPASGRGSEKPDVPLSFVCWAGA